MNAEHGARIPDHTARRGGVALIGAVITLVILSLLMAAISWQILAHRQMLEHRHAQLQAGWLARAGIERAAARLMQNPAGYKGETFELIPLSQVRVDVETAAGESDVFAVSCEATFPTDATDPVVRSATRQFRRLAADGMVRLEAVRND